MLRKRRLATAIGVGATAAALSTIGMAVAWAGSSQASTPRSSTLLAASSPSASCSGTVTISDVDFSVVGANVVVTFHHTSSGCPTTLHVHENLVASPHAGSDAQHQLNQDFSIGANGPTSVSVPLLAGIQGKCFVQVDVHFNANGAVGGFVPALTCPVPASNTVTPPTSPETTPPTTPETTPPTSTSSIPITPISHSVTVTPPTSTAPTVPVSSSTSPDAVPPTTPVTPVSQGTLPPVSVETGQQVPNSGWSTFTIVLTSLAVLLIAGGAIALLRRHGRHASTK